MVRVCLVLTFLLSKCTVLHVMNSNYRHLNPSIRVPSFGIQNKASMKIMLSSNELASLVGL